MVEVQRWEQRRMRLEGCCFMFKWTTCFQDFKYTQLLLTLMSLLELTPLPEERLRGERNRDFIQTTTTNTLKESLLLSMIYIVNNWAGFKHKSTKLSMSQFAKSCPYLLQQYYILSTQHCQSGAMKRHRRVYQHDALSHLVPRQLTVKLLLTSSL